VYLDGNPVAAIPSTLSTALNASLANPALQLDGGNPIDLSVRLDAVQSSYLGHRHVIRTAGIIHRLLLRPGCRLLAWNCSDSWVCPSSVVTAGGTRMG
jgi:hypothetical protein